MSTRKTAIAELWDLLYPQLDLLRDIGGLTVSGGEPLLQSYALRRLFTWCRESGIHTAVETSGALPVRHLADVAGLVDCWLFGLRPNPSYVPPHASLIDDNLSFVVKAGRRVIIRMPVIAGITDRKPSLERIAAMMQTHGLIDIELLPYNRETSHYYDASGLPCPVDNQCVLPAERLHGIKEFFERCGYVVKISH